MNGNNPVRRCGWGPGGRMEKEEEMRMCLKAEPVGFTEGLVLGVKKKKRLKG